MFWMVLGAALAAPTVSMRADGRVTLDGRPIDPTVEVGLLPALATALVTALDPSDPVYLFEVDGRATAADFDRVYRTAQAAGAGMMRLRLRGVSSDLAPTLSVGLGGHAEYWEDLRLVLDPRGLGYQRCDDGLRSLPGREGAAMRALLQADQAAFGRARGPTLIVEPTVQVADLWRAVALLDEMGHGEPALLVRSEPGLWEAPRLDLTRLPVCEGGVAVGAPEATPRARLGATEARGAAPLPAVRKAMEARADRIDQCAVRALPAEAVTWRWRLMADARGEVQHITWVSGGAPDSAFARCAQEALSQAKLPAGQGGELQVVVQAVEVLR